MLYRVTVESIVIVEAKNIEDAEAKVMSNPDVGHQDGRVLDLTVPCDKDGLEIEEA